MSEPAISSTAVNVSRTVDRSPAALLVLVTVNFVIALVALTVEGLTPTTVLYPILLVVGAVRLLRSSRGALFLLVVGIVMLVVHVPFVTTGVSGSCVHPFDSSRPCNELLWITWLAIAPLALAVAAALTWRKQRHVTGE